MTTILILINSDSGLFHFRRELLECLVQKEYKVLISVPAGPYTAQIEKMGCTCLPVKMDRHGMNPFKDAGLFLRYGRLIREYKPDIVLTYTIKPNLYGALQAGLHHKPCFMNITGLGTALQKEGILQRLLLGFYRFSMKKAACVFFQNEQNLNFMKEKKCVAASVRLIPGSGVNLEEYKALTYPAENGQIRILNITRIMKDKGIEEFLAAAENIKKRCPEVIFEIVGDYESDSRAFYELRIEELQKKGIIKYYGYQKDVKPFIRESHLIVNPTYHEGMSNVLLEAAASGRPVAATDIHGCKEIFEDQKGGLLFQAQNVQSLIDTLEIFLGMTHDERQRMGQEAREYVAVHFDRKKVVEAYLEEIQKIEK